MDHVVAWIQPRKVISKLRILICFEPTFSDHKVGKKKGEGSRKMRRSYYFNDRIGVN